jgi:peptidoglycan hydrolase CwlO-like protein
MSEENMSAKERIERDYSEYRQVIKEKAEAEIQKIRGKIENIKQKARETGEQIKSSSPEDKCRFEE